MGKNVVSLAVLTTVLFSSLNLAAAQGRPKEGKFVTGTVKTVSETSLVLEVVGKDKSKKDLAFALGETTRLVKMTSQGRKQATTKDVKPGDSAQVTYAEEAGKMVASRVRVTAAAAPAAAPASPPKEGAPSRPGTGTK